MTDKKTEALKLALKKAFDLGQRYLSWADSEYSSHWEKAAAIKEQFNQLVEDTLREALDEQPASKPWVGLTDEERGQVYASWRFNGSNSSNLELCRAIEAKLKEKNT